MAKKKKTEADKAFEIVTRTNTDNPAKKDVEALEKILDENPYYIESVGNRYQLVFDRIFYNRMEGSSVLIKETTKRYIKNMKTELGYGNSTFVEKMLIDEIALRWFRLTNIEHLHHQNTCGNHTSEHGNYWDRRLTQAQNRYLKAINTLAKVRKMIAQTQAKGVKIFKDLLDNK
jgi:hypothetical protein